MNSKFSPCSAKNLKLRTDLGISSDRESAIGFPVSLDSISANSFIPLPVKMAFTLPGSTITGILLLRSHESKILDVKKLTLICTIGDYWVPL